MAVSRRQFLKLAAGSGAGAAILAACRPAVGEFLAQSPANLPEDLVSGVDNWYASVCSECGAGCGVIGRVIEGRVKKIEGNPKHPLNLGKLCVRGQASVQAVYHPDRIRRPMKAVGPRGSGAFEEISWDEAMDTLLGELGQHKGAAGQKRVVLATEPVGGHLGMVVERFARAYGAFHAPFESMGHSVERAAAKAVFGSDHMPDFDLDHAEYLLSFGADFLMGWVSQVRMSRGYGEFRQGEGKPRGTLVHVDSRFSATAANADEWIPIKPGEEGKLALAMAYVIVKEGLGDQQAAAALFGPDPLSSLEPFSPESTAGATGVRAERTQEIARAFAGHQPGIALGGGSAAAHTNGAFNLNAIFALNHLVGSVGRVGGVMVNPSPPGALGHGGDGFPQERTTSFDGWTDVVSAMNRGEVAAFLTHNANPVHGLPDALGASEGLARVPFIASFSSFLDDTTAQADLVLPTHLSLEDWGDKAPDPGAGIETVGFQQPLVRPVHDTRGFGDLILSIGQDLGLEKDLPWTNFREVLRDGAQRLRQLNRGNVAGATFEAYWNNLLQQGGWWDDGSRDASVPAVPRLDLSNPDPELLGSEGEYPFHLVPFPSVSLGDGRGAHLPWLQATPDPVTTATWVTWVEMNMKDAEDRGLKEGDLLRLDSPTGFSITAPLYPSLATPHGVLAVPVGQGHTAFGRWAEGRGSNPLSILGLLSDRSTGALAWGATRVRMTETGERVRIPKFEGTVLPIDYDNHIKITRG